MNGYGFEKKNNPSNCSQHSSKVDSYKEYPLVHYSCHCIECLALWNVTLPLHDLVGRRYSFKKLPHLWLLGLTFYNCFSAAHCFITSFDFAVQFIFQILWLILLSLKYFGSACLKTKLTYFYPFFFIHFPAFNTDG